MDTTKVAKDVYVKSYVIRCYDSRDKILRMMDDVRELNSRDIVVDDRDANDLGIIFFRYKGFVFAVHYVTEHEYKIHLHPLQAQYIMDIKDVLF